MDDIEERISKSKQEAVSSLIYVNHSATFVCRRKIFALQILLLFHRYAFLSSAKKIDKRTFPLTLRCFQQINNVYLQRFSNEKSFYNHSQVVLLWEKIK